MKEFKLDKQPKIETGFKTPDDYFENFSSNIIQQLPKKEPKVILLFKKRRLHLLVAAVLFLALLFPFLFTFLFKEKELDATTLENYLTYQSNINQYDLILELEPEDISKMKTTIALEDKTIEDLLIANSNVEQLLIN